MQKMTNFFEKFLGDVHLTKIMLKRLCQFVSHVHKGSNVPSELALLSSTISTLDVSPTS
jgi:hypothetical protein